MPTAVEAGVTNYVVTNWFGFVVPKGTPRNFINTLRDDVVKALAAQEELVEELRASEDQRARLIAWY